MRSIRRQLYSCHREIKPILLVGCTLLIYTSLLWCLEEPISDANRNTYPDIVDFRHAVKDSLHRAATNISFSASARNRKHRIVYKANFNYSQPSKSKLPSFDKHKYKRSKTSTIYPPTTILKNEFQLTKNKPANSTETDTYLKAISFLEKFRRSGQKFSGNKYQILSKISTGYHSFNASASDTTGNIRATLSDYRVHACKLIHYNLTLLPRSSIIVIFHNEARSTLLRAIHSILLRTPDVLIEEIILVDDASTMDWLKSPLDDLVGDIPKTRLIRLPQREGLIRARLAGAKAAIAEVLVFLDAHTEVNAHWLEPLLFRIQQNEKVVAVPEMDIIQWQNFDYLRPAGLYHGSFTWDLQFKYRPYPKRRVRSNATTPIPSPVMVGCAHAVNRHYFFESGSYDDDMDIWGGENIEHSFRVWQCGGRVEIIPCSHVGHVFKPRLPFSFKGDGKTVIQRNLIRTAEVWMDNYKDIFYATQATLTPVNLNSLARRKHLRTKLECKDFQWYLDNVVPEMPRPSVTAVFFGQVQSLHEKDLCLGELDTTATLKLVMCEEQKLEDQFFYFDKGGRFMYKDLCIHASTVLNGTSLQLRQCPSNTEAIWEVTKNGNIVLSNWQNTSTLCLTLASKSNILIMSDCKSAWKPQRWSFTYNLNFSGESDIADVVANALKVPENAVYFGYLRQYSSDACLQVYDDGEYEIISCGKQKDYDQIIHLDANGSLKYKQFCMDSDFNRKPHFVNCNISSHNRQVSNWRYDEKSKKIYVVHQSKTYCLTYPDDKLSHKYSTDAGPLQLSECDRMQDETQQWEFTKKIKGQP